MSRAGPHAPYSAGQNLTHCLVWLVRPSGKTIVFCMHFHTKRSLDPDGLTRCPLAISVAFIERPAAFNRLCPRPELC